MQEITSISRSMFEDIENIVGLSECEPRSYSGRGMYGEKCFGFTAPGHAEVAQFFIGLTVYLAERDRDEDLQSASDAVIELTRQLSTDSMGYDMIAYFPSVEFEDE